MYGLRMQDLLRFYDRKRLLVLEAEELALVRIYSGLGLELPEQLRTPEVGKSYIPNRHSELEPHIAKRLRKTYQPFYDSGILGEEVVLPSSSFAGR
jgi:hypothetical protein